MKQMVLFIFLKNWPSDLIFLKNNQVLDEIEKYGSNNNKNILHDIALYSENRKYMGYIYHKSINWCSFRGQNYGKRENRASKSIMFEYERLFIRQG